MPYHSKNISTTPAKSLALMLTVFFISACSGGTGQYGAQQGSVRTPSEEVRTALCENRTSDAVTLLSAEPLAAPADRFYTALAFEQGGRPVTARRIYAELMNAGYMEQVMLRCGSSYMVRGNISEESGKHLAMIARDLQPMDVTPTSLITLHDGLPSQSPPSTANKKAKHTGPINVARPASQSPLGRWFAHLASYRSFDNAQKNKVNLEKKFPALANILDQWEVNVSGFAIRLGIRVQDKADATALCDSVKNQGAYCAVIDTSQ